MDHSANRLLDQVRDHIKALLKDGSKVAAVRYYHEVSLAPLIEAKRYVEGVQSGEKSLEENEGFVAFLSFMERQDLEGASASLCVYHSLTPAQAIEITFRFVDRMNIESTLFEPKMLELLRSQSPMAHQQVNERAIAMDRRMALSASPRTDAISLAIGVSRRFNPFWYQRIGKWAALVYAAMTFGGIALLLYSYALSPTSFHPLALSKETVPEEQVKAIQQWSKSNIPANVGWFFPIENYISFRLEPGLPSDFAFLDLEWEKKLEHLNQTAKEALAAFHRCHIQLMLFYGLGLVCAVWFYLRMDLVAAGLMTLIGLLGIRFLTVGWLRLEWENGYWLGPLLLPGVAAATVAVMTLALSPTETDRQRDLKGFWLGTCVFLITSMALGMAIANGGSFRANAGLGVFGGLLLMVRHGARLLRRVFPDRPSIRS